MVLFGLIGDGLDFPADPKEALRILELLRVAFQLLLVEGAEVRRAAIADEKGAEDNVNCTPFVRQYGILFRKWGVFVCQRDNESTTERRR